MIPWNVKYPTQNGEMINLDWIISEVKRLNQNLDELEARVLAAALAENMGSDSTPLIKAQV